MSPSDVKTMKLTRKDLVKSCAAQLLTEIEQEKLDAEAALVEAEAGLQNSARVACSTNFGFVIAEALKACGGRDKRVEYKVCSDIVPSGPLPEFVAVIVMDGTSYDNNFRLQFHVKVDGDVGLAAIAVRVAARRVLYANGASTRQRDLDTKAREKLIADALDSTEDGKTALFALARMRDGLKAKQ